MCPFADPRPPSSPISASLGNPRNEKREYVGTWGGGLAVADEERERERPVLGADGEAGVQMNTDFCPSCCFTHLIPDFGKQRQEDLCESEACLVYKASTRRARAVT